MVALFFEDHLLSEKETVKYENITEFTFSFSSNTRKIFPPISLIISSLVQFPCDIKKSINFG